MTSKFDAMVRFGVRRFIAAFQRNGMNGSSMLQDTKSGDQSRHAKVLQNTTFVLLLFVLVGCSRDGRLAASGTVTLDGKPLESGAITFQPAPGSQGNSAGGSIENGHFQIAAEHGLKPGKYFVTIQSFKLTGRTVVARIGEGSRAGLGEVQRGRQARSHHGRRRRKPF